MGGSLSNVQLFADKQMMKGTVLWFPSSDAGMRELKGGFPLPLLGRLKDTYLSWTRSRCFSHGCLVTLEGFFVKHLLTTSCNNDSSWVARKQNEILGR